MKGEFSRNMSRLIAETHGQVVGSVEVNQVYAHYQHEHPEFHHPDGGEAFYLKTPLFTKVKKYMQMIADHLVNEKGVDIKAGMKEVVEDLSKEVYARAPWEFGDLRASGHPTVKLDGKIIYDRPPNVHRLDEQELKDKAHLRYLYDPDRYGKK